MDTLTKVFFDVMHKYNIPFSYKGVAANLQVWRENKAGLIDILRRHPNWNEKELAVVFRVTESRPEIDRMKVDEAKFSMMELSRHIDLTPEEREDFEAAFEAVTVDYAAVPNESRLEVIQDRGGIKCAQGQKASRIINRLCKRFNFDQYQERVISHGGEQRTVAPYNSVFAQLADALNPMEINKTAVLSVHPCDFLEMSNRDNPWHSCHCLADGAFMAGCQSYMGDGVSMIFYTVDEDVTDDFYTHRKLTREIFCFKGGVLLQSRLYPNDNEELRKQYRKLVQGTLAACMGLSNLWRVDKEPKCVEWSREGGHRELLWTTNKDSLHYADYNNGYAIAAYPRDLEDAVFPDIVIGSPSLCPCCGEKNENHSSLYCGNCRLTAVCAVCGEEVHHGQYHYAEGKFYCQNCLHQCRRCRSFFTEDIHYGYSHDGQLEELCQSCYEGKIQTCEVCGVHGICEILGGGRLCTRSGLRAA